MLEAPFKNHGQDLDRHISRSKARQWVTKLIRDKLNATNKHINGHVLVVFPFAKYEERQRMYAALKIDGFVSRFAHFIHGDEATSSSASTTEASSTSSSADVSTSDSELA